MEYPFTRSQLSHLRRSINNNDKDEILLVFIRGIPFKADSSASPDIELVNFIKFPVNFPSVEAQLGKINVIGAANGLICFSAGYKYVDDCVIHVWNPSLSALFTVPPYAIPVPSGHRIVEYRYNFRFGFDPKNDDYKIVKLVRPKQSKEWLQVEVYSMKSGCWKLITQSPPCRVSKFYNHGDIFVCADGHDGYIHWLGYYDDLKVKTIVAFDLAAESFSEISLPDPINFDYRHRLGVFGGKLCVIIRSVDNCHCEVLWVMDQYGSWVKNGFSHFHKYGISLYSGITLKNNFIYEDYNLVLHLYDPAAPFNKVKTFLKDKSKQLGFDIIIPYVESVVWVTPPTC
ncbi:F-box/kelch-repeat protein-like protein [Tanacetum coccineum]